MPTGSVSPEIISGEMEVNLFIMQIRLALRNEIRQRFLNYLFLSGCWIEPS